MRLVLDPWAVLRLLEGTEPAASRVQAELDQRTKPAMIRIHLGEVLTAVRRLHGHQEAESVMRDLRSS